ncbi:hypothetical protein CRE_14139 [Caenorhabditis remanei]|uniref:Uncharacterized protein n=1 Tax=Caenorhabditis remanei TaxID=31234 RepID=E3MRG3_CAERE|nr:hypothetical protein CRE_14139 [Caenorhabditis remanei]
MVRTRIKKSNDAVDSVGIPAAKRVKNKKEPVSNETYKTKTVSKEISKTKPVSNVTSKTKPVSLECSKKKPVPIEPERFGLNCTLPPTPSFEDDMLIDENSGSCEYVENETTATEDTSKIHKEAATYHQLRNVKMERAINCVKQEFFETPKTPRFPPTNFFKKKNSTSRQTAPLQDLVDIDNSSSSMFSDGMRNVQSDAPTSAPLVTTPSYAARVTPFLHSKTGEGSQFSSNNDKWNPIGFTVNNLYNLEKGIPLSRSECEVDNFSYNYYSIHVLQENLQKLSKTVQETDFYPILELAQKFHNVNSDLEKLTLGLAFNTAMVTDTNNKLVNRLRQAEKSKGIYDRECDFIKGIGFDLRKATENEENVMLPCKKIFKLSSIVTPSEAAKWTSSRFYGDARLLFRFVFKEVAKRDPFFVAYSAQDYSNAGYIPFGDKFFGPLVRFVIRGFRQDSDLNIQTTLQCVARETMTNFVDRFRKEYKAQMDTTPKEVAFTLKQYLEEVKELDEGSYVTALDLSTTNPPQFDYACLI